MSDETIDRIAEWCAAEPDLDFADGVITMAGDPPLSIAVEIGDEAALLSQSSEMASVDAAFAESATKLLSRRESMIRGNVAVGADSTIVDVRHPVYLDGLSRHTFLLAVREIAGTVQALGDLVAAEVPGEPSSGGLPLVAAVEPEHEFEKEAERTLQMDQPQVGRQAAAAAAVPAAPVAWVPTHTVPEGGMSAWSEPNPALAPVAHLAGRVELRVDQVRGAWAGVTGSNGWTGWVDARRLLPIGAAPDRRAGAAAGSGGPAVRPIPLIGGLVMILGAFLSWISVPGSPNGFDVPLAVVWKRADMWFSQPISPEHPRIGLVILLLGIAVVALSLLPRVSTGVLVMIGGLGLLVGILFFLQIIRVPGIAFGDALDAPDIGAWLALAGSLGATVGGAVAPIRLGG